MLTGLTRIRIPRNTIGRTPILLRLQQYLPILHSGWGGDYPWKAESVSPCLSRWATGLRLWIAYPSLFDRDPARYAVLGHFLLLFLITRAFYSNRRGLQSCTLATVTGTLVPFHNGGSNLFGLGDDENVAVGQIWTVCFRVYQRATSAETITLPFSQWEVLISSFAGLLLPGALAPFL